MLSKIILWLALTTVVISHDDPSNGYPKALMGRHFAAEMRSRNVYNGEERRTPLNSEPHVKRANCGPGVGSCGAGLCCSAAGVCGLGPNFCSGPDCQFLYGPACDANKIPTGASTSGISRSQVGSVSYGSRINDCSRPGVFALTFDDGPFSYTDALLDLLDQYNAKATFFITGNNMGKGSIDDCLTNYPKIIKRIYNSGHQIASHTWTHQNLNTLSDTDFSNQMIYNEMAIRNIIGVVPTYFRPPYVDCNANCFTKLGSLGYHVVYYSLDTFDYANDSPSLIQNSKNYFSNYVNPHPNNGLVLSHDTHYQTVYNLTKFMLDTLASNGYGTSVTVGTCLGDPATNWYRPASGTAVTCGTPPPLVVSTNGKCTGGFTCQGSVFGNCCSRYNNCGSTSDYCGTGCQLAFGSCVLPSTTLTPSPTSTATSLSTSSISKSTTTTPILTSSSSTSSKSSTSISTTKLSTSLSTTTIQSTKTTSSLPPPTSSLVISTTGKCGAGITCLGSTYGPCCSRYSFCGGSADHCGAFCQPAFGTCSAPSPSATPRVSTDGSCGSGITCLGSTFGSCCSKYFFCGSGAAWCGAGCQVAWGTCT